MIGGRPADDGFAKYLRRFRGNRFLKGVRQVLHNAAAKAGLLPDTPAFVRGVQLLGEAGLCFDLCMRPGEIGDAVKLVEACPNTRFILDHCGNGPVYAKDRTHGSATSNASPGSSNVVCKVSGIVVQARETLDGRRSGPGHQSHAERVRPRPRHVRRRLAGVHAACDVSPMGRSAASIVRNRPPEDNASCFTIMLVAITD